MNVNNRFQVLHTITESIEKLGFSIKETGHEYEVLHYYNLSCIYIIVIYSLLLPWSIQ